MSDFLLIFPSNWTIIDWFAAQAADPTFNTTNVVNWYSTGQLNYIQDALIALEMLPPDSIVVDAKLFDGAYFAVLLG